MTTRTVTVEIPVPELTLETALWGLVLAAIAADLVTTQVGLANPAARNALEYGPAGFLALKAGAVGVGLCCRPLLEADHPGSSRRHCLSRGYSRPRGTRRC